MRTTTDKPHLAAFGTLLPEDQFEALLYLAEGFSPGQLRPPAAIDAHMPSRC